MAALCSTAEHCESDIRRKLQLSNLPADDIQAIIQRLYIEGYLDTARFCRAYANDQLRFAHWGPVKIAASLRQKGLPDHDIRQAIAQLPSSELHDVLQQVLHSKLRQTCQPTREKLMRFALARGFAFDDVRDAVDTIFCHEDDD